MGADFVFISAVTRARTYGTQPTSPSRYKSGRCALISRFVFNIRKSYTYDTVIILRFYKKRKKNQEYYPGLFSYYICTEYPTEQVI